MNKTLRSLLTLAIVFMLMVSVLAIPAFAAPDDGTDPTEPQQEITYAESEKLEMLKNFLMPEEFDMNDIKLDKEASFQFFESMGEQLDDEIYEEEVVGYFNKSLSFPYRIDFISYNGAPRLPNGELQSGFSHTEYDGLPYGSNYYKEGTPEYNSAHRFKDYERVNVDMGEGVKNDKVTILDCFRDYEQFGDGVRYRFKYPGQYIYEIYENNNNEMVDIVALLAANGIDLSMSNARYKAYVNVAVQVDEDGNVVYKDNAPYLYIDNIVVEVITPDNESQKAGDKVDNVTFTNSIVQRPVNVDPEDPDTFDKTLVLKKNVTGKYGDYNKEFAFDFKIDKPDVPAAEATTAKATKIDRNGNKLGVEEFTYGQNKEVKLKAGETLVFTDVYYGATWSFDEQGVTNGKHADGYTVTQAIKSGGEDADPADGEYIVKIAGENSHVFTNDKSEIETPTGVLIDNLPYIIIFTITAGGIILSLAMKRRRRKNKEF